MPEFNKTALVLGAGGFIGSHMVKHLVSEGYWVRGVDLKSPDFSETAAHEFIHRDLTDVSLKDFQEHFDFRKFDIDEDDLASS